MKKQWLSIIATILSAMAALLLCLTWGVGHGTHGAAVAAPPDPSSTWQMVGQIGGSTNAIAVEGQYAYVGVGLRLIVLDVSNPITPTEVGSTTPFPYFVEDVVVSGTLAYVAAGGAGLRVVDISDPDNPTVLGSWDSPGYAEGVAVSGNAVYLADGPHGLRIVSVFDPTHPTPVGSAYDMNYVFEVAVAGEHAYIAAAGAGLLIADVSDPAHPVEVSTLDTPGYAYGIAVSGTLAYVADAWEGLRVVNVSNPAFPLEMGACDTPGWALNVAVAGSTAYVADGAAGLRIVDLSNLTHPHEVGAYEVDGLARRVAVANSTVYVADQRGGLRVVDVVNPPHPAQVSLYSPLTDAFRVAISGSYAYVAAGYSGLRVVNVSDPAHPTEVASYKPEDSHADSYASAVVVSGTLAYLATSIVGPYDLHILDISDPYHPALIGGINTDGAYRDIALQGNIVYVANEWGLSLIDVSNPVTPTQTGFIWLADNFQATVGVAVFGTLAYVAGAENGMQIVDISNPISPTLVSVYDRPGSSGANAIAIAGDWAYVADDGEGLRVVDVSDPNHPTEVGSYDTPGYANEVTVSDTQVYVSDTGGGMAFLDVSNPITPTLIFTYDTVGYTSYMALVGNYLYVADRFGGLLIFERDTDDTSTRKVERPSVYKLGNVVSGAAYQRAEIIGLPFPATTTEVTSHTLPFVAPTFPLTITHIVTSSLDSGPGTLRQALLDAGQGDTILFNPIVFPPSDPVTINLNIPLPVITQGHLTIDASNAGVILDGKSLPEPSNGFTIESDYNLIRGLQILYIPGWGIGIEIHGAHNVIGGDRSLGTGPVGQGNLIGGNYYGIRISGISATDNAIIGNMIGTTPDGNAAIANRVGIEIREGASRNRVGGITPGERNIISGNQYGGIQIVEGATINVIAGNFIGTKAGGVEALSNEYGISICCRASHNRVGGTTPAERNLLSGNRVFGIDIAGNGATDNVIVGNYIGTDIEGMHALGNGQWGVIIWDGPYGNTVGGTEPGEGNLISGNPLNGVAISNIDANHNAVIGNWIGTDATGTNALGNGGGISLCGTGYNRVERNVISGNTAGGISVCGGGWDNLILGNFIGTDASGTRALSNERGISLGGSRTLVGGTTAPERNVIGGNQNMGIDVNTAGTEYNWIAGNAIGTNATGTLPLGNREMGVWIWDYAAHNFIQGNTIAFNHGEWGNVGGVYVEHSLYNSIRRNSIYSNVGVGIVLDQGGNQMLPAPIIIAVTETSISGTACPGCTVEIFSDIEDEGRFYEGTTIADSTGYWILNTDHYLSGPHLTATATDGQGNTSEFSVTQVILKLVYLPVVMKDR